MENASEKQGLATGQIADMTDHGYTERKDIEDETIFEQKTTHAQAVPTIRRHCSNRRISDK